MSEPSDSDDFLGWAPDLGSWDALTVPRRAVVQPLHLQAVAAPPPPPPPPSQAPMRRSGLVAHPPAPTRPLAKPGQWPASKMRVPVLFSFAAMLVITLWTALWMTLEGPQSSPVMLGVCGAVTALLGRIIWSRARR